MSFGRGAVLFVLIGALLVVACGQAPAPATPPMPKRIVDLSPTITEDLPVRAVGAKFLADFGYRERTAWENKLTDDGKLYIEDSYLTLFNHVGPHHDAPSHMIRGGTTTDQFPLDKFFGHARVFDFRTKPKDQPLTRADFEGRSIQPGEIVIAFVGYQPPTDPNDLPSYAYLSGEAAEYLAGLPIKAFASDMPSLGSIRGYYRLLEQGVSGMANFAPEHIAFLSRDIPNIEGLTNLESLVGEEHVVFVGFPLKIKDGNAGPIRPAALVY